MLLNLSEISHLPESVIGFLKELTCNIGVERLIVFGSRACGDYEQYSDLDLAIDAPSFNRVDWVRIREKAYYDVRTVIQISIVDFASNPMRLQERIMNDGVVIYEQQKKTEC